MTTIGSISTSTSSNASSSMTTTLNFTTAVASLLDAERHKASMQLVSSGGEALNVNSQGRSQV